MVNFKRIESHSAMAILTTCNATAWVHVEPLLQAAKLGAGRSLTAHLKVHVIRRLTIVHVGTNSFETELTVFITSFDDFDKFNAVYREVFSIDPPARTTVQVAALIGGARVELQTIAVKP